MIVRGSSFPVNPVHACDVACGITFDRGCPCWAEAEHPRGSSGRVLRCTPEERRRYDRGRRLAGRLREHWPEIEPHLLELLAPHVGRMVAAVLDARQKGGAS